MNELRFSLSREDVVFMELKNFHLRRVNAIVSGEAPLRKREGGILVLHLVPETSIFSQKLLDGQILKEHGKSIRTLGSHASYSRFNVDGFLHHSGETEINAYCQLFRDGRLESVTSNIGYRINQSENSRFALRCSLLEKGVFAVVDDYLKFCRALDIPHPVWLFSALVECQGFGIQTNRMFHEFSMNTVDRSPAIIPEIRITSFDVDSKKILRPWCDTLWQASGLEKSANYDQDGNWNEPRY